MAARRGHARRPIRGAGAHMLYLTRKVGESVIINDTIEVTVIEVRGKSIKLGFTFPPEATVLRREYPRVRAGCSGVKLVWSQVPRAVQAVAETCSRASTPGSSSPAKDSSTEAQTQRPARK